MNLEQMKESRTLRIKRETNSAELQRRKQARDAIDELRDAVNCPASEEQRLSREIDLLMRGAA